MTSEYAAGVKAVVRPYVLSSLKEEYVGRSCAIEYYAGSDRNGNYYRVTMDDTGEAENFYTSELDITPKLTKEEKAAKLKAELEKLEAEIKAEAEEKARNEFENLEAGTLVEIGVDDDTDYVVKVGEDKWHWFSKDGDPLAHHDTTTTDYVIHQVELAKQYGYYKIFPASED